VTLSEQETIIRFDETDTPAEIYTASPRVAGLLQRRGLKPYKTTFHKADITGWYFELPKSSVLLKPGSRIIRIGGARKINATPLSVAKSAESREV